MTDAQREQLYYSQAQYVSYGYFCGEDDAPIRRLKAVHAKPMSEAEFKEQYEQRPKSVEEWHLSQANDPNNFGV
jgi:hypothetical protein